MSTTIEKEYILSKLSYNPDTGLFHWNYDKGKARTGNVAGSVHCAGYILIGIARRRYLAHRLAWLFITGAWPTHHIDHINGIRTDNRSCNLRNVTQAQNNLNLPMQARNTSGHKGVWFHANRWRAGIRLNGKRIYLGRFKRVEDAAAAYKTKEAELFGEFSRKEYAP